MPTFFFDDDTTRVSDFTWFRRGDQHLVDLDVVDDGITFTVSYGILITTPQVRPTGAVNWRYNPPGFEGSVAFSESVRYSMTLQVEFTTTANRTAFSSGVTASGTLGGVPISNAFKVFQDDNRVLFVTSGNSNAFATASLISLTDNTLCFCEGTRIATPGGWREVQDLKEGDPLTTADGGTTVVRWLGNRRVDTRLVRPDAAFPIRIAAGALDNERDLYVSPDHGLAIDGYLINASALVNGATIAQVDKMPLQGFTYYHIETDAHELILAEGQAAETYLDQPSRDCFDNGNERCGAPIYPAMEMPRISSRRMLPKAVVARCFDGVA